MTLSTHVLDTTRGRPASGIPVTLAVEGPDGWQELSRGVTDADGRVASLLPANAPAAPGATLRLRFALQDYFAAQGIRAFYPQVDIVFSLQDAGHHHVPLLISPFGYSTYRGS